MLLHAFLSSCLVVALRVLYYLVLFGRITWYARTKVVQFYVSTQRLKVHRSTTHAHDDDDMVNRAEFTAWMSWRIRTPFQYRWYSLAAKLCTTGLQLQAARLRKECFS